MESNKINCKRLDITDRMYITQPYLRERFDLIDAKIIPKLIEFLDKDLLTCGVIVSLDARSLYERAESLIIKHIRSELNNTTILSFVRSFCIGFVETCRDLKVKDNFLIIDILVSGNSKGISVEVIGKEM